MSNTILPPLDATMLLHFHLKEVLYVNNSQFCQNKITNILNLSKYQYVHQMNAPVINMILC